MNIEQKKSTFNDFLLAAICTAIYLSLAIGRVIPFDSEDSNKAIAGGILLFLFVCYFVTIKSVHFITNPITIFSCITLIILMIGSMQSKNIGYLVDKIHGSVLVTLVVFYGLANSYHRHGIRKTHKTFLLIAAMVLLITVAYKLRVGFFDRNVRFLINGPIVFGWIMGYFCIVSFQISTTTNALRYWFLGCVMFTAVIWTQSKGPLLALLFVFVYSNYPSILKNKFKLMVFCCITIFLFSVNLTNIENLLTGTRFSVALRLLGGDTNESDEGSIGSRMELIDYAIAQIQSNPFMGIGLGQFEFAGYKYPHNQHLEIAIELGIPVFILHVAFIGFCLLASHKNFRSYIIYFFTASLFSGDISYLRFLYTFALLGLISKKMNTETEA